jgi:rubrerythrin
MTCPFCGNADKTMMELTNKLTHGGLVVYICHVCSHEFYGDDEPEPAA